MIAIDLDTARRLTREVVDEYGATYTYPSSHMKDGFCVYVHQGKPSCLVGHVLHRAGVPIETLYSNGSPDMVANLLDRCGIARIDHSAVRYLGEAQQMQDRGASWGSALLAAENEVPA